MSDTFGFERVAPTADTGGFERAPDMGRAKAVTTGLAQGMSANWLDELAGVTAAGGDPVSGLAMLGYEYATGKRGPATEAYEKARDRVREKTKTAKEQYPGTVAAGEIAGAVSTAPLMGAANAPTLLGRMAQGARIGGTYGAISGAGQGEGLTDTAVKAGVSGALGAGIGGLASPVVEGAIRGGQALARPVATAFRGAINPELEASRRVAGALERDIQADPQAANRLTPQEFGGSVQTGGPATIMDIGGETTRALARSAANTSPEGRAALNETINDRFEGQSGRIATWLNQTFHYPNATAQQEALQQSARTTNRVAYDRAYQEGAEGLWSPQLERLAGSDAVSGAMQAAAKSAKDEAIVGGYGAANPRVTFTPDGRIQFARGPTGVPTYPDLQYWDLVRRELSDAAQRAGRGTSEARRLNNFATQLNSELDRLIPTYRQAREGAAGFFNAENALEAGQNFVTANLGLEETRRVVARMAPVDRQLFQDGFVSRLVETIERTGDRRNVVNQIMGSPQAREKIAVALGPQRAQELEATLRVEGIMDLARGAVQGNSTTARQWAELGFAGGAGGIGSYGVTNLDPASMTTAAVMGALLAGRRGIDQRVSRHVAEMLTSQDPQRLMQGIRLVARSNNMMNSLRAADRRLAVGGASQTPNGMLSPVQAPAVGRAEEQ